MRDDSNSQGQRAVLRKLRRRKHKQLLRDLQSLSLIEGARSSLPQRDAQGDVREYYERSNRATQVPSARHAGHVCIDAERVSPRERLLSAQVLNSKQGHYAQAAMRGFWAAAERIGRKHLSFVLCVILPIILACFYYFLIASNEYVSEFRFAVKEASAQKSSVANGLMGALGMSGGPNIHDNYLVTDYLSSRQAAEELQKRINVVTLYAKGGVDWLSKYNPSQPMEKFVAYWQSKIVARYDPITGIATAQVRAFTPEDTFLIANTLVALAEELVNGISSRSQNDAVQFAQREVDRAEDRLRAIRAKLTEYRVRVGVIDPSTSVVASNSTLTQTLQSNLAQLELQEATLLRQNLRPDSPAVQGLKSQIKSTKEQITSIEGSVGNTPAGRSLSTIIGEYEQLDLERQFAQTMVTSTMQVLDQARANAASQHLYITPFVRPSLPESSTYPRRLWSIFVVGILAWVFWFCGLMIFRGISERFS